MTQTSIQKTQEKARLLNSCCIKGDYYKWSLLSPGICSMAAPGQFVDIQIPGMAGHILRRPFSICNADATTGILTIVYKVVGAGTRQMAQLPAGTEMNILGPLGHGFSTLDSQIPAVLVGGGYGCAAMLFTARMASVPPVILLGGRTAGDIILNDEFTQMGCDVRIATNDGSLGTQGFVTVLLEEILKNTPTVPVAACGPAPMLKAVGKLCENYKNTIANFPSTGLCAAAWAHVSDASSKSLIRRPLKAGNTFAHATKGPFSRQKMSIGINAANKKIKPL